VHITPTFFGLSTFFIGNSYIAVRNGFKPEQMLKATENMLKEECEENPASQS